MSSNQIPPSAQQVKPDAEDLFVPEIYVPGFEVARRIDPDLADNYVRHATIGDPLADAMVDDVSQLTPAESIQYIQAVMESEEKVLANAPASVQALYHDANTAPQWLDLEAFGPGIRAFHANAPEILGGMVGGVLVEGFSTAICESFLITGRLREQGVRRLKQNNRHMLEIFLPGGLNRYGDGWRLSVRIRIVHARIRHLLSHAPRDWSFDEMGTPVSSAHMGFAISSFSARLLQHATSLGATFSNEERASFMQVWRYSGHLMGIPDTILYCDETEALKLREVAQACEPEPSFSSIIMANALINSAPLVIGISDPDARKDLVKYVLHGLYRSDRPGNGQQFEVSEDPYLRGASPLSPEGQTQPSDGQVALEAQPNRQFPGPYRRIHVRPTYFLRTAGPRPRRTIAAVVAHPCRDLKAGYGVPAIPGNMPAASPMVR